MTTALVVINDGRREYMGPAMASLDHLHGDIGARAIIDDSGDLDNLTMLRHDYPTYYVAHHEQRQGLAAAVRTAWAWALETGAEFVFHFEQDFVLTEDIDLDAMAMLLRAEPSLAQLVLKRNPWSQLEKDAGGQMEIAPDEYLDCSATLESVYNEVELYVEEFYWTEHITENAKALHVFSFNPCLIRREAIEAFFANHGDGLERGVTDAVLAAGFHLAYWGRRTDPPRAEHIGVNRSAAYKL